MRLSGGDLRYETFRNLLWGERDEHRSRAAHRCGARDTIGSAYLRLEPPDFHGRSATEPSVIARIPAASVGWNPSDGPPLSP